MTLFTLRAGLCALAAAGGATALLAQAPAAPTVVRVPGTEVILRSGTPGGGSTTVVNNSGNGVGNRIVVSGTPGLTVVKNARNGIGNRLILDPDELLIDLDDLILFPKVAVKPPVVAAPPAVVEVKPAPPVYAGKANPFWAKKAFSDAHDCNLYWSAADKLWFRYSPDEDKYRPVANQPAAPKEE